MQSKEMIPIFIPVELLQAAEITPNSILQGEVSNGALILKAVNAESGDFDCDGDCDECGFFDIENDCCPIFDDSIEFTDERGESDE